MEEYRDLDLTVAVFTTLLDEDEFLDLTAGIVLQAYLPDSMAAMVRLQEWAVGAGRARGSAHQGAPRQGRQPVDGACRRRDPWMAARHMALQGGVRRALQAPR